MPTSLRLWPTTRKRMVMTRPSGGKHHSAKEIGEVAESLRQAPEDFKNLQERNGRQGPGDSQQDGAAVSRTWRGPQGVGTPEVSPPQISKIERRKVPMVPKRASKEPIQLSFASPNLWNALLRDLHMSLGGKTSK